MPPEPVPPSHRGHPIDTSTALGLVGVALQLVGALLVLLSWHGTVDRLVGLLDDSLQRLTGALVEPVRDSRVHLKPVVLEFGAPPLTVSTTDEQRRIAELERDVQRLGEAQSLDRQTVRTELDALARAVTTAQRRPTAVWVGEGLAFVGTAMVLASLVL